MGTLCLSDFFIQRLAIGKNARGLAKATSDQLSSDGYQSHRHRTVTSGSLSAYQETVRSNAQPDKAVLGSNRNLPMVGLHGWKVSHVLFRLNSWALWSAYVP